MQLPSAVHISLRIFLHFNAVLRIFFPLPSSLAECFFFLPLCFLYVYPKNFHHHRRRRRAFHILSIFNAPVVLK